MSPAHGIRSIRRANNIIVPNAAGVVLGDFGHICAVAVPHATDAVGKLGDI